MAYTKTNWQNLPDTSTPINETNLNKIENELEQLEAEITQVRGQIKTETFSVSITPSTERGVFGYGETVLDISRLNATKILGLTFHNSSTFLLWGTTANISQNPTSLTMYAYRMNGTYSSSIAAQVQVIYQ